MNSARGAVSERVRRALYTLSRGTCYAPDCDEPVIVIEDGQPIFVGDVAHIVAATKSGPRGGEAIDDREGFANLLLLCARHHRVIDHAATRERYPVEVLKQWKAEREAGFDQETLDELARLRTDLPDLLVTAFRDITAKLDATITKLQANGDLAQDLAQLLQAAVAGTQASRTAVGDGPPGIKETFEAAYDAAGGASFLGLPSSEAIAVEPGFVQRLRGGSCGHPALICALRDCDAVVITADLWNAIRQAGGGGASGGQYFVGLPVSAAGGGAYYIGPSVALVPMVGGAWGAGVMERGTDGAWRWTAELAFDSNAASDTDIALGRESPLDLRLRLVAYAVPPSEDPRLSSAGRRRLTAALGRAGATDLVANLAAGRVEPPDELEWTPQSERFGRNDSLGASYQCVINAANGRPAIRGTAQYLMPHLFVGQVASVIDLEVDFTACRGPSSPVSTDLPVFLTLPELVEVFSNAWMIAHDVLPLAMTDDVPPNVAGRPRVSFHVVSEHPPNGRPDLTYSISDLVDLSPFGTTTKNHLSQLSLAVLGRGAISPDGIHEVVRAALTRMAEDAGYVHADLARW